MKMKKNSKNELSMRSIFRPEISNVRPSKHEKGGFSVFLGCF